MTIIAWDGHCMAADKMAENGLMSPVTKIRRIGDMLVGGAGSISACADMFHWFEAGCDPDKWPPLQRSNSAYVLVVKGTPAVVMVYESSPYPTVIERRFHAIGSGRDFAMAAMHLGRTAKEAVELASVMAVNCGLGVDLLYPQ